MLRLARARRGRKRKNARDGGFFERMTRGAREHAEPL